MGLYQTHFSTILPIMMQYMISIISWEIFYILIEHRGEQSLAVSNSMRNIFGFLAALLGLLQLLPIPW